MTAINSLSKAKYGLANSPDGYSFSVKPNDEVLYTMFLIDLGYYVVVTSRSGGVVTINAATSYIKLINFCNSEMK